MTNLLKKLQKNWPVWAAGAASVALAALELFADYLPLLAGSLGGWPLVLVTFMLSAGLGYLRTKKRKARAKSAPEAK